MQFIGALTCNLSSVISATEKENKLSTEEMCLQNCFDSSLTYSLCVDMTQHIHLRLFGDSDSNVGNLSLLALIV